MRLYVLMYEDELSGENTFYGIFKDKKSVNEVIRKKKKELQEESWYDDDEIKCLLTQFVWYTDDIKL